MQSLICEPLKYSNCAYMDYPFCFQRFCQWQHGLTSALTDDVVNARACCASTVFGRPRGMEMFGVSLKYDWLSGLSSGQWCCKQSSTCMYVSTMVGNDYYHTLPGPGVMKRFSCSAHLSMKCSLLINMKKLLEENFSCSATFSKKEFSTILVKFGFISRARCSIIVCQSVFFPFFSFFFFLRGTGKRSVTSWWKEKPLQRCSESFPKELNH